MAPMQQKIQKYFKKILTNSISIAEAYNKKNKIKKNKTIEIK